VFSPATGEYLELTRVSVEGSSAEAFTDATGQYRLGSLPAGRIRLRAFRTGFAPATLETNVMPGRPTELNFELATLAMAPTPGTVRMERYTVGTSREMDGAAIAINTQRFAPNVMNVVAADEFGAVAIGNVGEVLKSVPGVTIGLGGLGAAYTIGLNGVPPENVPVTIGGFTLANAASGTGRAAGVNQISINNTARVEVIHTPTPETTGSALAGSVNLVPRSAFERTRTLVNVSAALMFRDDERTLAATPGPQSKFTHKANPQLDVAAIVPLGPRLGFTVSASTLRVFAPQDFSQLTWRGGGAATNGGTLPDTTPDRPYLTDYAVRHTAALQERDTWGLTADAKLTPRDRISLSYQGGYTVSEQDNRTLTFLVNRVTPGDFSTSAVRGFTGAGEIRLNNQSDTLRDTLHMPSLSYWHDGPDWKLESGFGFSRSHRRRYDLAEGYFNTAQARRTGVTVSFSDVFYLRPGTIAVTDASGRPVDPYALATYNLDTAGSNLLDALDVQRNAFASARRDFAGRIPFSLKAGLDARQAIKDVRAEVPTWTFVGADGVAGSADDNAAVAADPVFSQRAVGFGFPRMQRLGNDRLYDVFRTRPAAFTTNAATTYTASLSPSKFADETIAAAYLRGDTTLAGGRLRLVGGIRAEQTRVSGQGQLIDPTRNYQRDSAGRVVAGANGRPVALPGTALEVVQRTNVDRGLRAEKEYLRWFPSLNATFALRENVLARAGYYHSVGRPNFNQYAGSLTLPDPESPPGPTNRISVNNAGIKAWNARTVKASLEWYFEPVGMLSVGAFRREIENFFGNTVFTPTTEFLGLYGLDPSVYGRFDVATQSNLGSTVRMTGLDLNYKQALTFLPGWARGIQVFANASTLRTLGEASANFAGFIPFTANWGASLNRPGYLLRARWNYQGRQRRGLVAAGRSIEAGTYTWGSKRLIVDLSAECVLFLRITAFASVNNWGNAPVDLEISGPSTPEVAQFRQRTLYGPLWTVGLKRSF
jgi:TonB-dependent receptor